MKPTDVVQMDEVDFDSFTADDDTHLVSMFEKARELQDERTKETSILPSTTSSIGSVLTQAMPRTVCIISLILSIIPLIIMVYC